MKLLIAQGFNLYRAFGCPKVWSCALGLQASFGEMLKIATPTPEYEARVAKQIVVQ